MQEEPARRPKSTSIRLHTTSATPNRSSTSNTNRSSTSNTNSPGDESSENGVENVEKSPPLAPMVVRTSPPGLQRSAPGARGGQGGREQEGLKDVDRDLDRDLGSSERRISYASLC